MFAQNPLQWWNRFGDMSKPCPKHICSYSPNVLNYPTNNYELYNNPMMGQMMGNPLMNQMMSSQMMNSQMMNSQMIGNQMMMPTSSNYATNNFNDIDLRHDLRMQTEPRLLRDFDTGRLDGLRRSFNQSNRNDRRIDRNEKSFKRAPKYDHANQKRYESSKRSNTNSPNSSSKRIKKHQSF